MGFGWLTRAMAMMTPGMFLLQPDSATFTSYHCAPIIVSTL
jgi:hypothetical protein